MTSNDSPDTLAFDRDLPTTAEDVVALRRLRAAEPTDLESYIAFLEALDTPALSTLRGRKGPTDPPLDLTR